MFNRLAANFDGGAMGHAVVGRKATREISKFLDAVGAENLSVIIKYNAEITGCLPAETKENLKAQCQQFKSMLPAFKDIEVYGWIPPQYRSFIESHPTGKQWAILQVQLIRTYLLS